MAGGLTVAFAPVVAAVAIALTKASALAITKSKSPLVAFAITIDLSHHCRRAVLMLVNADGKIAQYILAEPFLPLDLVESRRRPVYIEKSEMRLAVLSQPIGKGLQAPLLRLSDLASYLLDHSFELRRELFDLLRAGVLARQEDVFVERHVDVFPFYALSGAKPLRAS